MLASHFRKCKFATASYTLSKKARSARP